MPDLHGPQTRPDAVPVTFPLVQDDDGYPPIESETMWVQVEGEGLGVLDNNPFFALDVSCGQVSFKPEPPGPPRFREVTRRGGNSTVRVIAFSDEAIRQVRALCDEAGCDYEIFRNPRFISINVPSGTRYGDLMDALAAMHHAEAIECEESCRQHSW